MLATIRLEKSPPSLEAEASTHGLPSRRLGGSKHQLVCMQRFAWSKKDVLIKVSVPWGVSAVTVIEERVELTELAANALIGSFCTHFNRSPNLSCVFVFRATRPVVMSGKARKRICIASIRSV